MIRESGLVLVIASGQNIDRAISVYRAALAAGRELVIDPYQAYVLMTLQGICPNAPQFHSPSVRVKFINYHVVKLKEAGLWGLACQMSRAGKVTSQQLAADPGAFVYLARSSTATVALLRYLMKTSRPTVVWSQWAGYLKKGGPIPDFCSAHKIEPVLIHSGGHAHPKDLADLVSRLNPKVVIPIHTEAAAQFATFLPNVRVVRDGEAIKVASLVV